MTIDQVIAQLRVIRKQHGNLPIAILDANGWATEVLGGGITTVGGFACIELSGDATTTEV